MFFVLSGYVLTRSLVGGSISLEAWRRFFTRRLFRLFPLYWCALLLAFAVLTWIKGGDVSHEVYHSIDYLRQDGPGWQQWLLHIALVIPGMQAEFALPTVWSLMTESKVALLVFPFLGWLILRLPWQAGAAMTTLLVLGSDLLHEHVIGTAAYLGMFSLGGLLARVPERFWHRLSAPAWCGLLLAGVAAYSCMSLRYRMPSVWMGYYLCAVGAAAIIACVSCWPALGRRMHGLYSLVGVDLSYGIYLLHYPVLLLFFKLAGELRLVGGARFGPALAAVVATVVLARILAHAVEIPMVRLGRKVVGGRKKAHITNLPPVRDVGS